jgi:ankyrin repeat protein
LQNGATPLHYAAKESKLEVATLLLDRGADKEAKTKVRLPRRRVSRRSAALALRTRRMATRRWTWLQVKR